jgi:Gas vesicle protein G
MGLITGLLTLPLAPVRGVTWIARVLEEEAEHELYDEDVIRRELAELEWADEDEMTPEERHAREENLLGRLAIARERRAAERESDEHG